MKRLFRPLRRWLLRWEIAGLEMRLYDDQRAVDLWPHMTKPSLLRELARLKSDLDRLNGRKDRVNWSFSARQR